MNPDGYRSAFAILCFVGAIFVAIGAGMEVLRSYNGRSIITARHLRVRIASAIIWMLLLTACGYALLFEWPAKGDLPQAERFIKMIFGVVVLLLLGLLLLALDFVYLARQRHVQEDQMQQRFTQMAQEEIARARENARNAGTDSEAGGAQEPSP